MSAGVASRVRSAAVEAMVRRVLRPLAAGGRLARGPLPSGRRLLLLHLDGVGHAQLLEALRLGYAPTLARLLERGRHRLGNRLGLFTEEHRPHVGAR